MSGIPNEWEEVVEKAIHQASLIILIGAVDTGKSTLSSHLANYSLKQKYKTAVIDADVGQSDIGPPTTVGLGILSTGIKELCEVPLLDFYFVGSTSPYGNMVQMVAGTKKMVEKAFELDAERVIINTTGLVQGNFGHMLKHHKIDLLKPNVIIGLQREKEIEPLLRTWEALGYTVYRVKVAREVRRRSTEERTAFRQKRWQEFFSRSRLIKLPFRSFSSLRLPLFTGEMVGEGKRQELEKLTQSQVLWAQRNESFGVVVTPNFFPPEVLQEIAKILNVKRVTRIAPGEIKGRVIALLGKKGQHLSLGCVAKVAFDEKSLFIYTPYQGTQEIRLIVFGSVRLNLKDIFF